MKPLGFVDVRGIQFNRTPSGPVVVVVGLDELAWTKKVSDFAAAVTRKSNSKI
jgi:hypothetical protein